MESNLEFSESSKSQGKIRSSDTETESLLVEKLPVKTEEFEDFVFDVKKTINACDQAKLKESDIGNILSPQDHKARDG